MENAVNKLIQTAKKWNGYLEKKSNKDLDSMMRTASYLIVIFREPVGGANR